MIAVSCRKDFIDAERHSEEGNEFRKINLSTPHIPGKGLTEGQFLKRIPNKGKVLILVHGYNNEYDSVCGAYSIIKGNVRKRLIGYGLIIGYFWPGMNNKLEFWIAIRRANETAERFRELLNLIATKKNNVEIDIMSHSLGARVVLGALKKVNRKITNNYFCMAAAVDNEVLEKGELFYDATKNLRSIHVFHTKRDWVLRFGYRAAQCDRALGTYGPENLSNTGQNVYTVNCNECVRGHNKYKDKPPIYEYIENPPAGSGKTKAIFCPKS